MKIEDIDIYHLPLWACAVVDEIDKLLFKYPFISKLIDRDEIEEPMDLTLEQTKALSRFLALDADREDYERIQLYLMGCQHTIEVLQLLELL